MNYCHLCPNPAPQGEKITIPNSDRLRTMRQRRKSGLVPAPAPNGTPFQYVAYDATTGLFTNLPKPRELFPNDRAYWIYYTTCWNKPTGTLRYYSNGSRHGVSFNYCGKKVWAHRAAWEIVNGKIPAGMNIDHANGNPHDNRISNLRLATRSENMRNSKGSASSGLKGAYWSKDKELWYSRIRTDDGGVFLGYHKTKEEAHSAYCEAATKHFGAFARFK